MQTDIDEGLYSRQLYVLGHDAMRRMQVLGRAARRGAARANLLQPPSTAFRASARSISLAESPGRTAVVDVRRGCFCVCWAPGAAACTSPLAVVEFQRRHSKCARVVPGRSATSCCWAATASALRSVRSVCCLVDAPASAPVARRASAQPSCADPLAGADTHTDGECCSQEPGAGRRQVAHVVRPQARGPAGSLFAILLWGG